MLVRCVGFPEAYCTEDDLLVNEEVPPGTECALCGNVLEDSALAALRLKLQQQWTDVCVAPGATRARLLGLWAREAQLSVHVLGPGITMWQPATRS